MRIEVKLTRYLSRMTGSIRLRRDDDRNIDDGDSFGNICGSTFFYDSSNKRTKKAEERTSRLDMPLENLTRNFLRKKPRNQKTRCTRSTFSLNARVSDKETGISLSY